MNTKYLASAAFVILGIVALLSSISILQGILTIPYFPEEFEGKTSVIVLAYVFPFALLITTGVLLIVKRERLASWVSRETQEPDIEGPWDDLPDLAFAVLGLYFVVATLPSLGSLAGQLINIKASANLHEFLPTFRANVGHYLGTLAELVVGAYLFMNARRVGRWWRRHGEKLTGEPALVLPRCPECGTQFEPGDYREGVTERLCAKCHSELPQTAFD